MCALIGQGTTKAHLNAIDIQASDIIAHQRLLSNTVTHIVVVYDTPTKEEGAYTNIPIMEAQGWDDGHAARGNNAANYHSSEERVVKHNYITEYMNLIGRPTPSTPYIQHFYVLRFK